MTRPWCGRGRMNFRMMVPSGLAQTEDTLRLRIAGMVYAASRAEWWVPSVPVAPLGSKQTHPQARQDRKRNKPRLMAGGSNHLFRPLGMGKITLGLRSLTCGGPGA